MKGTTMTKERDIHFQGFAKLLLEEIMNNNDVWFDTSDDTFKEDWQLLIAQRSYDLVYSLVENAYQPAYEKGAYRGSYPLHEQIQKAIDILPDFTEFPPKTERYEND